MMSRSVKLGGMVIVFLLVVLVVFLLRKNEAFNPWEATSVPYDSTCSDNNCEPIGEVFLGHFGNVEFAIQSDVDDAIVQWGECLDSLLVCMEQDGAVDECVDRSTCPQACKKEYHKLTSNIVEYLDNLGAIETLFVKNDGLCRATMEQVQ